MNDEHILKLAEGMGFSAAFVDTKDVVQDPSFRKFCEDNLCGKYNANYSCPPACGRVEEVHSRLFSADKALVLQTIHEIGSYENKEAILTSKKNLNITILKLTESLRARGLNCFCLGYGGCPLCNPCKQVEGEPCAFPEKRISCMSAYCIYVKKLADDCKINYGYKDNILPFFGMYIFN